MQSYVRYRVAKRYILIRDEWESNGVLETMGETQEVGSFETDIAAYEEADKRVDAEPNYKTVFMPGKLAA